MGFSKTEIRERKSQAFRGYLAMNILSPPVGTIWGEFNDRRLEHGAVKKLLRDFRGDLENSTDDYAIEVAIRHSWLKVREGSEKGSEYDDTVEGKTIDKVKRLELNETDAEAIAEQKIWMLGGNHRRAALELLVEEKKDKLEQQKKKTTTSEDAKRELEDKVKELEQEVERASHWAIKVYDRGE
jgi:hypothetical protein